jgi:hypothetical protein
MRSPEEWCPGKVDSCALWYRLREVTLCLGVVKLREVRVM